MKERETVKNLGLNVGDVVHTIDVNFVDAFVQLHRLCVDGLAEHLLLLVQLLFNLQPLIKTLTKMVQPLVLHHNDTTMMGEEIVNYIKIN